MPRIQPPKIMSERAWTQVARASTFGLSTFALHHGDARAKLRLLPSEVVNTCLTSPPYLAARDYEAKDQIGLGHRWTITSMGSLRCFAKSIVSRRLTEPLGSTSATATSTAQRRKPMARGRTG